MSVFEETWTKCKINVYLYYDSLGLLLDNMCIQHALKEILGMFDEVIIIIIFAIE